MTDLLLRPLADAFMQVGVFVAALVAPFGWARMRCLCPYQHQVGGNPKLVQHNDTR